MRLFLILAFLYCLPFKGHSQFKEKIKPNYTNQEAQPIPLEIDHKIIQKDNKLQINSFDLSSRKPNSSLQTNKIRSQIYRVHGEVRCIKGGPTLQTRNAQSPLEQFFEYYKADLSVDPDNVQILDQKIDDLGQEHLKLQQTYRGIPVYGAQATLHGEHGFYNFYLGSFKKNVADVDVNPVLSVDDVDQLLMMEGGEKWTERDMPTGLNKILNQESEIKLIIYIDDQGKSILAYQTLSYPDGIHPKKSIIDANTGLVIKSFDAYCKFHNHTTELSEMPPPDFGSGQDLFGRNQNFNTWREGSTYYLLDASRPMFNASASNMPNDPVGAIWTLTGNGQDPQSSNFGVSQITSSSTSWNNRTAVSAHLNGSQSYEYFANTFGRNSINGQAGTIVSILNAGSGNAFWNGQAIFYGNEDNSFEDLAAGLDVAGHEMSHGVIQNTANLEYYGESGALNESFADIFGAMIDRDDWLIGEDVVKTNAFPSGALRNMMDPHNGGSGIQDLNRGWQPNRYSERFTGSEDNNGVHINSGISNRAFYLFANNSNVGKAKAEQVYFKVLDDYLTRSSDFADLRAALEQVVSTDYGTNSGEWTALQSALNTTEFPGGGGVIVDPELESNPGDDFILLTTDTEEGIYIADPSSGANNNLVTTSIISRPSVTDDGSVAVYVDSDKNLRFMVDFPGTNEVDYIEYNPRPIWRNVIISKDGNLLAALTDSVNNALYVINLNQGNSTRYELYNPTFTDGITTGDVLYADAMEFSSDGEFIIYDAINSIQNNSGEDIEYWDIGFINVWDRGLNDFGDGRIQKLFNQLPDDVSIGNPTFAKNSPNVIAFDLLEDSDWFILGMNIETNEYQTITANNKIGYPSYSTDDVRIVFDRDDSDGAAIYFQGVDATKIAGSGNFSPFLIDGAHWGVWYGTGERVLTAAEDLEEDFTSFNMYPNPTGQTLNIDLESDKLLDHVQIEIINALGQSMYVDNKEDVQQLSSVIDVRNLQSGLYILNISSRNKRLSRSFVKE